MDRLDFHHVLWPYIYFTHFFPQTLQPLMQYSNGGPFRQSLDRTLHLGKFVLFRGGGS